MTKKKKSLIDKPLELRDNIFKTTKSLFCSSKDFIKLLSFETKRDSKPLNNASKQRNSIKKSLKKTFNSQLSAGLKILPSIDRRRVDENGYLKLSKDEISYIISHVQKLGISFLEDFFTIHIESYKESHELQTYARLASYVYGDKPYRMIPEGWMIVKYVPGVVFNDDDTGLKSILYRNGLTSDFVYAFAGTRNTIDWRENGKQIFGLSKQYNHALANAKKIVSYYPNCRITFTGHSQGGGEAAMCAYSLGKKAITFNPAGMSVITKMKVHSESSQQARIDSYIYLSDILNIAQTLSDFIPFFSLAADGEQHYIYDYIPQSLNIKEWHGMDGYLNYLRIRR